MRILYRYLLILQVILPSPGANTGVYRAWVSLKLNFVIDRGNVGLQ